MTIAEGVKNDIDHDQMLADLTGLVGFLDIEGKSEYKRIVFMLVKDNQTMFNLLKEQGHDFDTSTTTKES